METAPFLLFQFNSIEEQQFLVFSRPERVIEVHRPEDVLPALREIQAAVEQGWYAAGYVAYEAAPAFDPAFAVRGPCAIPLLWFGLFEAPGDVAPIQSTGGFEISEWHPDVSREEYHRRITQARAALARGESYQINYTLRLRAQFEGDDLAFYHRLAAAQRSGYFAYLNLGRYRILSASPELFFSRSGTSITTRPMKGTARRGRWLEEDELQANCLGDSTKDRAENTTIVDLLRNDLSRICRAGSVQTPRLFTIERYRTVFQMTSTITGEIPAGATLVDLFTALFPCGSVTGAPKISTMRWITDLENSPRQIYCGAIGFVKPGGDAVFNVAIRTVLLDSETGLAEYGVGGGITWDSDPEGEYEEALAKAKVLKEDCPQFELLETILIQNGTYALLERHLERLQKSARYFDIPVAIASVRTALEAERISTGEFVVRLLVSQKGEIRLERKPLNVWPGEPLLTTFASRPVSSGDCFLFHKTTNRQAYERARAGCGGVFDVLCWNERGEVTEFSLGNLVVDLDGQRWTPPVEAGLLAGTLRAELLETAQIQERVLTCEDVRAADSVWLINGVRGWRRMRLAQM